MSLTTYSKFYYGYEVTSENYIMDFDEGSGEFSAELQIGSYSLTEFAAEIARAFNAISVVRTFSATVNRANRTITISADGAFDLLLTSGSHFGVSAYGTAGFSGADLTGLSTYTGSTTGNVFSPQFVLQDHVATNNNQKSAFGTVNKAASGAVEVVTFGNEQFLECSIKWTTDLPMPCGALIRNNPNGVSDLRDFMLFAITKAPIEYMADENDTGTFETLILESTPEDQNGIGFKLREQYARGLPGFFETGVLKFRVK